MMKVLDSIKSFYEKQYKKLLILPFLLLVLAIAQISFQVATTGDFIHRDVSLKGGVTVTVPTNQANTEEIRSSLKTQFPNNDLIVRKLSSAGNTVGVTISIDLDTDNQEEIDRFLNDVESLFNVNKDRFTVEIVGKSLGLSFFKETSVAILIAFIFMGIVVFLYFRTLVPSGAVILAAFSDIIVTLAIVNTLGIKLSSAGIAAFLMLIGYSVDTDILLTTRLLKRREGTIMDRVYSAIKTGLTMNITTMVALTAAIILTESNTISQIMTILLIGLVIDMINTWIQNTGILRMYMEKKYRQ